jgi:hypothetical protein
VPDILIRQANIAALTTVRPFSETGSNWRFRRCPYPRGLYTILLKSTAAAFPSVEAAVLIGTTEVVQRGPVNAGTTDGVFPVPETSPAHQFIANQDDEIVLELYEVGNVATTDVMIWANVEPA